MRIHRRWSSCAIVLAALSVVSCAEGQFGQVMQNVGKSMAKGMCAEGNGPASAAPEFCLYVTELRLLNHDSEADVSLTVVNRTGRRIYLTVPSWPYLTDSSGAKWNMTKNTGIVYSGYGAPLSLEPNVDSQVSFIFQRQGQAPSDLTFSMRGEVSIAKIDSRGEPVPGQPQLTRGFNFSGIRLVQQAPQQPTQPLQQKSSGVPAPASNIESRVVASASAQPAQPVSMQTPQSATATSQSSAPSVQVAQASQQAGHANISQRRVLKEGKRLDDLTVAYIYHKLSGEPLDLKAIAAGSPKLRTANSFDRQDILNQELARVESEYASADVQGIYQFSIGTGLTYDHDRQVFTISSLEPGVFVSFNPLFQDSPGYRLAFVNTDSLHLLPMEKEKARVLDQRVHRGHVITEINARVIGVGDPTGTLDTKNTLRAVITELQVVDNADSNIIYAPTEIPKYDQSSDPKAVSMSAVDILGLKVGMSLDAFRSIVEKEYGKTGKVGKAEGDDSRLIGGIGYEPVPCYALFDKEPKPGSVCIRGYYDEAKVIRKIIAEQVFEKTDWDDVRKSLLKKYGGVATAEHRGNEMLYGWGPKVALSTTGDYRGAPNHAVLARVSAIQTSLGRSTNRLSSLTNLRVRLIDPTWAGTPEKQVEPQAPKGPKL